MKFRCGSSLLFTLSFVCCFGLLSAPRAWGQKKAATTETTAKPNASERKTETFEDLTEHFEGDTDKRGFPMNLFPAGTQGGLVWAALGAGALGGLLAAGGGSIAMVNYESQTSPQSKPDERLAARSAGRVGLGVFGLGALLMFAPPLLIDWALPAPTDVPGASDRTGLNALPADPTQATPVEVAPKEDAAQGLKKLEKKKETKPSAGSSKNKTKKKKEPQKKPAK